MAFPHAWWSCCNCILRALEKSSGLDENLTSLPGFCLKEKKKNVEVMALPAALWSSSLYLYTCRKIAVLRNELKLFSRHLEVVAPTCAGNIRVSMRVTGWWTLGRCEGYSFDTVLDGKF